MKVNRERQSCFGRGFTSLDSILYNLFNPLASTGWINRTIVATPTPKTTGGAGWYVIDDQTGAPEPYIVVSNHQNVGTGAPDTPVGKGVADLPNRFDEPHKIIKITETAIGSRIELDGYLWWDTATQTGYGRWINGIVDTKDDGPFIYDFRGGPDFLSIGANNNTSWSFVFIGDWFADVTTDWFPYDKTVASDLTAPTASGPGTDVVLTFLNSTEANRFEVDRYYYLTDYNGVEKVEYVRVKSISSNTVTIYKMDTPSAFTTGSVLAAYAHRFYGIIDKSDVNTLNQQHQLMPYCSAYNTLNNVQDTNEVGIRFTGSSEFIGIMSPDDEGNYAVEEVYVNEYVAANGQLGEMNNTLGKCVGAWMSSPNDMTQMQNSRTIELPGPIDRDFIYMKLASTQPLPGFSPQSFAFLIPDYDSDV